MQLSNRDRDQLPSEPRLFGRASYERSALVGPIAAARWLLVFVLLAGVYFFHGFLVPVLAALVIGFASWPIYRRLLGAIGGNRTIGATIAIIAVISFIVAPISLAAVYAVDEVHNWAVWTIETNAAGAPVPVWLTQIPGLGVWLGVQWGKYVGHPGALGELVQLVSGSNIGNIYRGVLVVGASAFQSMLTLLFMLITLFFVYRDGEKLVTQLDHLGERILPMRWERVSRIVPLTISSTVTGMGIIAIGEGIVLGIAYWMAGGSVPGHAWHHHRDNGPYPRRRAVVLHVGFNLSGGQRVAGGWCRAVHLGNGRTVHRRQDASPQACRRPDQAALPADIFRIGRRRQDHGLPRPVRRAGADGAACVDLAGVASRGDDPNPAQHDHQITRTLSPSLIGAASTTPARTPKPPPPWRAIVCRTSLAKGRSPCASAVKLQRSQGSLTETRASPIRSCLPIS